MKTTLELQQAETIRELEYKLSCLSGPFKPPFLEEVVHMDELIDQTVIHLPIYANVKVDISKIKLAITVRTTEGFACFYSQPAHILMDIQQECQLFQYMIERFQNEYIKYLQNKYKKPE